MIFTVLRIMETGDMSRKLVWLRGGDLDVSSNFTGLSDLLYLYGSAITYHLAEANGTSFTNFAGGACSSADGSTDFDCFRFAGCTASRS